VAIASVHIDRGWICAHIFRIVVVSRITHGQPSIFVHPHLSSAVGEIGKDCCLRADRTIEIVYVQNG
jgi:hypothetical protein